MSQESDSSSQENGSGVVFRAPDGTVYFIRDEVLNACRQPEEVAEKLVRYVSEQGEAEDFSIETSQELTPVGKLVGPIGGRVPTNTVMCSRVLK